MSARVEVISENGVELTWYFKRCRFGMCFDERLDRDTGWWFVSQGCDDKLDEALDGRLPDELINVLRNGYDTKQRIADLEQQLAETQRHNELLRAVANTAYFGRLGYRTHCPICDRINGHDDECEYKAAIDGGALEESE